MKIDTKDFFKFLGKEQIIFVDTENNPTYCLDNTIKLNTVDNDLLLDLYNGYLENQ